jgi:nitroreductase
MAEPLDDAGLDQLFRTARTYNGWREEPLAEADMRAIYDLAKWGPTSANSTPARFVWLASEAARRRLVPLISEGNRAKTLQSPVTVIVAYDLEFTARLPVLNPRALSWFEGEAKAYEAFRSGTLQGAYLIMAARALGWDCGPMGGIDRAAVDREFFPDRPWRSNFIISIGRGAAQSVRARAPRLAFEDACQIL